MDASPTTQTIGIYPSPHPALDRALDTCRRRTLAPALPAPDRAAMLPLPGKAAPMSDVAPLRYGILGAANIARQFTRGVAGSALAVVDAVASRGGEKAAAFATELAIPRHHASYDALLADPAIEAIYIPLPNDMHGTWSIRCAEAGKHVLCEKPLAMNAAEAQRMYDAARVHGVHLVEAYPYMSQPQTLRVRALLAEGTVGQIQLITTAFGFGLVAPDGTPLGGPQNIRLLPERGGGGLLDAGTYAMSMARIIAGERPRRRLGERLIQAAQRDDQGSKARPGFCRRGAEPRRRGPTKGRGPLETHLLSDEVQGLGPWWVQGKALAFLD